MAPGEPSLLVQRRHATVTVMPESSPRRRIVNEPRHAHFVTFSCYRRQQLLVSDWSRQLVCDSFDRARGYFEIDVWAYVVMPEHVHALVWPRRKDYDLGRFLGGVKRYVSTAVRDRLEEQNNTKWLDALTVRHGGNERFRFWQKGGGFDKNVWSEEVARNIIDYIHENPVRRELVDRPSDWRWSSAAWYDGERDGVPLRIDPVRS